MATQLQLRRGTTAENDVFTGAVGELTMDTDTNGLRIHDGSTVGGVQVPTSGTADYVVEWQAPTDLNNYTWYRKYKSGWVEQGGVASITMNSSGATNNITLPIVMADANYAVSALLEGAFGNRQLASRLNLNRTTYVCILAYSASTETQSCYWQVSGMSA
jgi:hypothetical protein